MGCGSGILSIVGMKLGAGCALGLDIDDNASRISVENAGINEIDAEYLCVKGNEEDALGSSLENKTASMALDFKDVNCGSTLSEGKIELKESGIRFFTGNVLEDAELCEKIGFDRFDVVVANILADIIIPLSTVCSKYIRKGTLFVSSGIINSKEDAVRKALLDNDFEIIEVLHMNDWVAFVAKK